MSASLATPSGADIVLSPKKPGIRRGPRIALHVFLIAMALLWLLPIVGALYSSFRPYSDTQKNGVFSLPDTLTLQNYRTAWGSGEQGMWGYFKNTMFIVIPALILILLLSSVVAFAVSRFSWRFNVPLLLLFTAANLLPVQAIFYPLFTVFRWVGDLPLIPDLVGSKVSIILIHVAFQMGFCTFVMSNYMKTIPKELTEAALVDGASVIRQYFQLILPLCRPVIAALATLEFTWLYNDFFWARVLLTQSDEWPITSAISNLSGQYFTDDNLVAAASMIICLPTLAVYIALQKQFISGLTLGANKG
jgi:multiple sugar transport system permease protein